MLNGSFFWFLMGAMLVLIVAAFKVFAEDRGWKVSWWKWLLVGFWYVIFSASFYAWGTLIGENEGDAGFKLFLIGLFISIVLGVGLWRLLTMKPRPAAAAGQEASDAGE
jgi:hypothetical protein